MKIRVDTQKVEESIALLTKAVGRGKRIPRNIADYGKKTARRIAPKDTGALKRGIQVLDYGTKRKSAKARLVSKQPNHRLSGTSRPYHLWMHGIGKYDTSSNRYKKGKNPKYMFRTAELMEKKINDELNKVFK